MVTFDYASEVAGRRLETVSWIDTYNAIPNSIVIPYAWDNDTRVFSVTSTASDTTIDSTLYLSGSYSSLLYNALTSPTSVVTKPGTTINGTIECPSEGFDPPASGEWEWLPYDEQWPVTEEWRQFYLDDVVGVSPYGSGTIDLSSYSEPAQVGPIVRQGDLSIDKSGTGGASTLVLDGTMYISGDLNVAQSGSKNFVIDLNYNTIFVGGTVNIASASTFVGSGSIISVGAFTFQPMMASGTNDFVFVCSLSDYVQFQPNGNFCGSVAGIVNCQLQPGNSVTWNPPPGNLNLPGMEGGGTGGLGSSVTTYNWIVD